MSVLVAGIGNIFPCDDAFGIEVVRRLATRSMPDGVRIVDFGIRGFDLANALIDSADSTVLLVDATPRGGQPGMLYLLEPSVDDAAPAVEPTAWIRPMSCGWCMHWAGIHSACWWWAVNQATLKQARK